MNKTRPYVNRLVKRKQQQIEDSYHSINLKEIKPMNSKHMEHSQIIIINRGKRQMINEVRQIEIERQNKALIQKLARVIDKKGAYSVTKTKNFRTRVNKSLNQIYRRRQQQNIQLQNKRFLQRLQNKRPTVNTQKLNKEWSQNKSTIKRMANVDFHLTNIKFSPNRKRSLESQKFSKQRYEKMKLLKVKTFDGEKMLIKIEFTQDMLKIVGDAQDSSGIKIIEIPKDQAIIFLQKDCQGKFQVLLQKLKYDADTEALYIVSQHLQEEESGDFNDFNPQIESFIREKLQQNERNSKSGQRSRKKTIKQLSNQSIESPSQKIKASHVVSKIKTAQKKLTQEEIHKSNYSRVIVRKIKQKTNKTSQKYEDAEQKKQISKKQVEHSQKICKKNEIESKMEEIQLKSKKQYVQEEKEDKDEAEKQKEAIHWQEVKQNQGESHQKQVVEQPLRKPKENIHQKPISQEPLQRQIIIEPESLLDYNQQVQVSAQVKKVHEIDENEKKNL